MFSSNKYTRWYYQIITNATNRNLLGYYERHHIIPKCIGGTNEKKNIIKLTAKEHFICHLLLIKMVDSEYKHKLVYAAWQLSRKKENRITSRTYQYLKEQLSKTYKGRKRKSFSLEWRKNMSLRSIGEKNNMYGKNHTEETKEKIRNSKKGKQFGVNNPFYGKSHTPETIAIIAKKSSEKQKGRPKSKSPCSHCGLPVAPNIMKRYHGENCKIISSKCMVYSIFPH